jgi:hypothetical protein
MDLNDCIKAEDVQQCFEKSKFIVWITSWAQKGSYAMYDIFVYPLT